MGNEDGKGGTGRHAGDDLEARYQSDVYSTLDAIAGQ